MTEVAAPTHKCPRDGCERQVGQDQLACAQDWYKIPKPLRDAVWRAWDHGAGAGSAAHTAAITAAIAALNRA
jgi:hypothetical protein